MEKTGIKETKEMLCFVLCLGEAIVSSLKDGKIGFGDLMHFFKAFQEAGPALGNSHLIVKEILDLSEKEKKELMAFVQAEFDLENDLIETYVEKGISVVIELISLLSLFKKK
jgi:hypothetical protein